MDVREITAAIRSRDEAALLAWLMPQEGDAPWGQYGCYRVTRRRGVVDDPRAEHARCAAAVRELWPDPPEAVLLLLARRESP